MAWSWFSVKTLYRVTVSGRPRDPDVRYAPNSDLVEARVVLVRARSFDEALRKGEAERHAYLKGFDSYRNSYGQTVRWRYLRIAEAFQLFGPPGAGREVFSQTYVVEKKRSDQQLIKEQFGRSTRGREWAMTFLPALPSKRTGA